jgi:hypothetical protein
MAEIAHVLRRAADSVEDFRGDHAQLASLMQTSWGEIPATTYLYSSELLADAFAYPGASRSLAPSLYDGDELIAFVAGYPRRLDVRGAQRQILISTFLTVAAGRKDAGYGIVVWSELIRRARAAGYDGVVNYCVDRGPMDRMIAAGMRLLGVPLVRAASFFYLTLALPPAGEDVHGPSEGTDRPSPEDLVTAAAGIGDGLDVCRLWSREEAEWQLSRLGAIAVRGGPSADPAVLTAYVISFADEERTRCIVVDDVLWGGASAPERVGLVHRLLVAARAHGARAAALPLLGYADARPFVVAGFVPSPHTLHAYLTLWSAPVLDAPVRGFYLDVM